MLLIEIKLKNAGVLLLIVYCLELVITCVCEYAAVLRGCRGFSEGKGGGWGVSAHCVLSSPVSCLCASGASFPLLCPGKPSSSLSSSHLPAAVTCFCTSEISTEGNKQRTHAHRHAGIQSHSIKAFDVHQALGCSTLYYALYDTINMVLFCKQYSLSLVITVCGSVTITHNV